MGDEYPSFPVDDATLDLLWAAIHPRETDPEAKSSSLWSTLEMISMMAPGAEIFDREYQREDGTMAVRQEPRLWYTDHSVIAALIVEVRRLRADTATRRD